MVYIKTLLHKNPRLESIKSYYIGKVIIMSFYYYFSRDLFEDVYREFLNNRLYIIFRGQYNESKYFKKAVQRLIYNICILNSTNDVGHIVHEFLKSRLFGKPEYKKGVYKEIKYKILPVLWKNRKAIERKKQKKLTFLSRELYNAGRYTEAHIVRTIVKPCIRDMNMKWSKMKAEQKLEACKWKC